MQATVSMARVTCGSKIARTPTIVEPTDALIRLPVTCICGSDLWPYRGIQAVSSPAPMGHEYCGIVEEVGAASVVKPGQFVIGSFFASDNTCPHCQHGYQTSCERSSRSSGRRPRGCVSRSRTAPSWRPAACRTPT